LSNTGANSNTGNWDVAAGRRLKLDGATLANSGVLSLNGGSVTGSGTLINQVGGTLSGRGVISSGFTNAGQMVVGSNSIKYDVRGKLPPVLSTRMTGTGRECSIKLVASSQRPLQSCRLVA
jgi:hypothetical protein